MRVLHINTTSHTGGAARAMRRLHSALVDQGHQSQFLVGRSISPGDPDVHLIYDEVSAFRSLENSIKSRVGNQLQRYIGIHPWANRPSLRIAETEIIDWADIIDLRNLFGGYFNLWSLPEVSKIKPVVWRMPDLWAVTGHCAYPYDCLRWRTGCFACPLLTSQGRSIVEPTPTVWDGTSRVWREKKEIYQNSKLHVIVTTKWMMDQVKESILGQALSISVISNGVDLNIYKPANKAEARRKMGLNPEGNYLLWAAGGKGNRRKGYHLAVQALEEIQEKEELQVTLLTMGGKEGWDKPETLQRAVHFGYVQEQEEQSLIYAAADAFLCTTLADGQPQTALESLSCGTPLIAYDVGPMPELAVEGETGWIVPEKTPGALRELIEFFYHNQDQHQRIRENCRRVALDKFDLTRQTQQYISLYESILARGHSAGN